MAYDAQKEKVWSQRLEELNCVQENLSLWTVVQFFFRVKRGLRYKVDDQSLLVTPMRKLFLNSKTLLLSIKCQ